MSNFMNPFSHSHRPGMSPPPVPGHTRPQSVGPPPAGAIYAPGRWPTPELLLSPLGPSQVLDSPEYGWTSQSIQIALDSLSDGGTLYLPKSSHWEIYEPIKLRPYQELATEGYPVEEHLMAVLDAMESLHPHVINAFDLPSIRLRNVLIDGNIEKYGKLEKDGGALVMLGGGNAKDQWVDRCIIRNPRGWSCMHAFEGCRNIRITNNRIGPAGYGKDVVEGQWADGISFSAMDSLVAGNEVIDATDGAIVVFQAPGSLITSNTIVGYSRLMLGAINMVDWAPYKGDYSHTRVIHNTILTAGSYIIIGIGQGQTAWGRGPSEPDLDKVNRHAVVARNLIHFEDRGRGQGAIGYGFAISPDVEDWTCVENVSGEGVVYEGDMTDIQWQGNGGLSAAPSPFVRGAGAVEKLGKFQPEFAVGLVRGLLGIKPGKSAILRLFPGQLRLKPGEYIQLRQHMFEFCRDGEIIFRHRENGQILWWAGSRGRLEGREDTAILALQSTGHLRIVDWADNDRVLFSLTPQLPPSGDPRCDPSTGALPSLYISDDEPHVCLTTPMDSVVLSSSYERRNNSGWPVDSYLTRPSADGRGTLVFVLSPYAQYMILGSKGGVQISLPITWPLDEGKWQVLWTTPNPPLSQAERPRLQFQGDGNLVIYVESGPVWASGTTGGKTAHIIRWGTGTPKQPYLELLDEQRKRVWSV